jgi:hypothetical protein
VLSLGAFFSETLSWTHYFNKQEGNDSAFKIVLFSLAVFTRLIHSVPSRTSPFDFHLKHLKWTQTC